MWMMAAETHKKPGMFIRSRREGLNMTQADLAKRLNDNGYITSVSAIRRIEAGDSRAHFANPDFIRALSIALGTSTSEILEYLGLADQTPVDTRLQRIAELASMLDPDGLDAAEQVVKVLLDQQQKRKGS